MSAESLELADPLSNDTPVLSRAEQIKLEIAALKAKADAIQAEIVVLKDKTAKADQKIQEIGQKHNINVDQLDEMLQKNIKAKP